MQAARGASLTGDHTATPGPESTAATARPRRLLFALVAAAVLATDQLTKYLAERHLGDDSVPVVGRLLQLHLAYNPGAAFSLGTGVTWVFAVFAVVAAVVVLRYALGAVSPLWAVTLGVLFGGITGNLTDRMLRPPGPFHGHVVDFLMLPHWPIFNVADIAINAGFALVLLQLFRGVRMDGSREERTA